MSSSLKAKEEDVRKAKECGADMEPHRVARALLHRIRSGMNRRMHKGFPEMLSYLLRKPMEYSSHDFVPVTLNLSSLWSAFNGAINAEILTSEKKIMAYQDIGARVSSTVFLHMTDYPFRPEQLAMFTS